jgi:hypothetical protein
MIINIHLKLFLTGILFLSTAGQSYSDEPVRLDREPLSLELIRRSINVQQCWNVGSLSTEALQATIVVEVELGRDGVPFVESIILLESNGTSEGATGQAFEAARRAIIRCGAPGFQLSQETYEDWKKITLVFDPNEMKLR